MEEEYQDLIDEDDNVIGKVTRGEVKRKGLLHRAILVFVFNSKRELYMQKRSKNKFLFPGLWGIGAGGGVSLGESYEAAAIRELEEELGITNVNIEYIFNFSYRSDIMNNICKVYKCIYDGEIKIKENEVEKGDFKTIDEIKQMVEEGKLCPDTALIFEKYLELEK
jgi:isopentenyl-diphosphate delta-isomerase type 1